MAAGSTGGEASGGNRSRIVQLAVNIASVVGEGKLKEVVSRLKDEVTDMLTKDLGHFEGRHYYSAETTAKEGAADDAKEKEKQARNLNSIAGVLSARDDSEDEDESKQAKRNKAVINAFNKVGDTIKGALDASFNMVQQIHDLIKRSSPLLETVESLFNLAMTLLFMPLGNALAETILPAMISLVEKVVGLWDTMDEQFHKNGLSGMLSTIFNDGVRLIGQFIRDLASDMTAGNKEKGGLFQSIINLLLSIGNFIEKNLTGLLGLFTNFASFMLNNLPLVIGLITGFKVAALALSTMTAVASLVTAFNTTAIAAALTVGIAAVGAGAVAGAVVGGMAFASGGYVPDTPGGREIIVAEGGEGEFIIPESKVQSFANQFNTNNSRGGDSYNSSSGGSNTYNITFNGLTDRELREYVEDIINDQLSRRTYRSGY